MSSTAPPLPSPQQQAVFSWVRNGSGSAAVGAVAGSGKTFTLVRACDAMTGSVALAAFNKKIAVEVEAKVRHLPNVKVGTFHSFGFAAWRRHAGSVKVDADLKRRRMLDECKVPQKYHIAVARMVSIAKQAVVGVHWQADDAEIWEQIIRHFDILVNIDANGITERETMEVITAYSTSCVEWSRSMCYSLIDFDDMIWAPLVEGASIQKYDWVLVDEYQDTNAARLLLARKMLADGGRAIFVGDRNQAIYGFTGADSDAVDNVIREFNCTELPLSVTYRCCKAAVKIAQEYVPQITAHEANPEGTVTDAPYSALLGCEGFERPRPGDAILCRITRPLVKLAFALIRDGISCHVEGRDIGKSLAKLTTRWKVTTAADLVTRLETYRTNETNRLLATGEKYTSARVETLNDRIDTILIIAEGCDTVDCVTRKIENLFRDTEGNSRATITLSTVHKSKGREWDRVYILGYYEYMPSKWARQEWELQQERNLIYVAVTRCRRDLVLTSAEPAE